VLSGRGLCDKLITRLEESYRLWRIVVRDQETSLRGGHSPLWAAEPEKQQQQQWILKYYFILNTAAIHLYKIEK
jgi:hypothetical protein